MTKSDSPASTRIKHAVQLGDALKLDMTAWFTPTAVNYFSKVSKTAIIEAIHEATGTTAPAWSEMKKADLAALAERKIAGTGRLPEPLRAPAQEMSVPEAHD